jgi:hypothetical protein
MEFEAFERAKKVKEQLDRLENQKYKLERSLKSCFLGATITYSTGGGSGEVILYNKEAIKEMISKELERLKGEIGLVKEEFENI